MEIAMADARGLTGLGIHTTFFILHLLLIAETPKIVKGRYFKGYGFWYWFEVPATEYVST